MTQTGTVADLGIGVLMLDTRFQRLPGDIGNARSWSVPVQFRVVRGASPRRVIEEADPALLQPFIEAAQELIALGVRGIATSCGFLALFQQAMAAALPVPVATSSLLQAPLIERMLPAGRRVGILTYSPDALTPRHLAAVGVAADTPIGGLPAGSRFRAVYGDRGAAADPATLEAEVLDAALDLTRRHPEIGALLLECTNLPPHSAAIARATGLPVHDIIGFIEWFARSLAPPAFPRA